MNYGTAQMRRLSLPTIGGLLVEAERLRKIGKARDAFTLERACARELRRRARDGYRPLLVYRR